MEFQARQSPPYPFSGRQIAIAGPLRTRCGLQRGADLMIRKLHRDGVKPYQVDISKGLNLPFTLEIPEALEPQDLAGRPVSDLVIHMNPPTFKDALAFMPESVRQEATIIGYWAWEAQKIPQYWKESAHLCDEIWCPSPFVAEALFLELPQFLGQIKVVPHPVEADPFPRFEAARKIAVREKYGLGPQNFVIGFTFSFDSNYSRKNPTALIDAFRLAFPDGLPGPKLLIRCNDAHNRPRSMEHLQSYAGGDPRIHVIDVKKEPWPLANFYNCLDVYLSLHRSEGYGLPLVEAAQAGAHVITTGWGLPPDIARLAEVQTVGHRLVAALDYDHVYSQIDGAMWAEPDAAEAARFLRLLRDKATDREQQR